MDERVHEQLRKFPAVHRLLSVPRIEEIISMQVWSREQIVNEIGWILDEMRAKVVQGKETFETEKKIEDIVVVTLYKRIEQNLVRVINGTGVILHTNLGRARLAELAIEQMIESARNYTNLEYNIEEGNRGSRHDHVEKLICRLTGAEAAMVVNNNAAAVFLVLRELAKGKEVIVSRGQLVEIGGSFRVSEIMAESGAKLVEVGTTNKTRRSDYEQHITEQTALLLKVHTSNFRIVGFTEEVPTHELVQLAHQYDLPLYEDLGSGVLYDLRQHGIGDEPTVQEIIKSGVDLVSFSGDKLLGGPQAGIIAGKRKWIERLKKNQLMRILRVDKMTLAGLEATLRLYFHPGRAVEEIPTLRDMLQPLEEIQKRAEQLYQFLREQKLLSDWHIEVIKDVSEVGGGTLPTEVLPTYVMAFSHTDKGIHKLEIALRNAKPSVITRVSKERLILDFRMITKRELELLQQVFLQLEV